MSLFFVKSYDIPLFLIKLVLLCLLFYLMNFDPLLNVDFDNYADNYNNNWRQFEVGFEFLADIYKYFGLSFSSFWTSVLVLEIALISLLYRNNIVFLFAFPNLVFLSQGLLGTQIRFGLAICLFFVIFSFFYKKRYFWLISIFPIFFHNAVIVVYFLANCVRYLLNSEKSILLKRNTVWLILFIGATIMLSMLVDYILNKSGYYYYVGTKYQDGRSLSSVIYMITSCCFLFYLSAKRVSGLYAEYLFLGFIMILFSLIFYQSSVISGRYNLVYTLLEPFILFYFYNRLGKKKFIFPLFLFYCFFCYFKVLAVDLKV